VSQAFLNDNQQLLATTTTSTPTEQLGGFQTARLGNRHTTVKSTSNLNNTSTYDSLHSIHLSTFEISLNYSVVLGKGYWLLPNQGSGLNHEAGGRLSTVLGLADILTSFPARTIGAWNTQTKWDFDTFMHSK
jgi:hypothetical protein